MGKNDAERTERRRLPGIFELPGGYTAAGELLLKGAQTLLRVHSDSAMPQVEHGGYVEGRTDMGERVSLINCYTQGSSEVGFRDEPPKHRAEIFPHYVAIGRRHLRPTDACVTGVHFTTTDLPSLFFDFDSFSLLLNARPVIDAILAERRAMRNVEAGEAPQVAYFIGKHQIAEVNTRLGKISVHHRPTSSMGGPEGVYIKNRIVVSVEPSAPITFETAMKSMHEVCCFLALAAGRSQTIERIDLSTTEILDGYPCWIRAHESLEWKAGSDNEGVKPHPGDVPLDPIRKEEEFRSVFTEWIRRHESWRVARQRYLDCIRMGNNYGVNRLVAAANMFDILPSGAVPEPAPLEESLSNVKQMCIDAFRALEQGADRDSALSALGRLGKPSLPKKVAQRVSIVEQALGAQFPELQLVTSTAVKCRNFFVHGGIRDIDFEKVEPLVPFFTDALEFVFAASDLLDCGWRPADWASRPKGLGHVFTRFRLSYDTSLTELKKSLQA